MITPEEALTILRIKLNGAKVEVPNYQTITIEQDSHGTHFLYMGDNFVAFNDSQWKDFQQLIAWA